MGTNLPTFLLPGPVGAELRSGWHQTGRALTLFCPLCILGCCLIGFSYLLVKCWLGDYYGLSPVLVFTLMAAAFFFQTFPAPPLHRPSLSSHPRLVLCLAVLPLLCCVSLPVWNTRRARFLPVLGQRLSCADVPSA